MDERDNAALSALVKQQADRYVAPASLHARIGAALAQAAAAADMAHTPAATRKPRWQFGQGWWRMGAAFAAGVLLSLSLTFFRGQLNADDRLLQQVVDSHVRSLMVAHLSDVVSTDQHTVKPWFDGKLDFSPPVHDLAPDGFALEGGRLDFIDQRPVAALVYRHRLHSINVFVWPIRDHAPVATSTARRGFNVKAWQDDGMQFWAVSDVQSDDLGKFAQLLREKNGLR